MGNYHHTNINNAVIHLHHECAGIFPGKPLYPKPPLKPPTNPLQEGTLSLIHIPLDLYSTLLQPILKILLPPSQDPSKQGTLEGLSLSDSNNGSGGSTNGFLNISVTPLECSIVCDSSWAESVFEPAIRKLPKAQARAVAVSKDTYAALSVYGAGMDAGSRVVELTSPLALANIPIFFITTYCRCSSILSCWMAAPILASPEGVDAGLPRGRN